MKRDYVIFVAKQLAADDDKENKAFGELLLQTIPEDDRKIPRSVIEDIRADLQRGIEQEQVELEGVNATRWTQDQALRWIAGSPFADDPPNGWSKRDLAMFARGYACGRAIQKTNDNEILESILMALDRMQERF